MSDRATRSRSFETVAAEYERHRPEYPEDALSWAAGQLGLDTGARVLDVGAGTGKLTRGFVALGFDAVAVEPGAPMLAQLREAVPEAKAYEAPAESIPLPDASVDAGFAGQAFHWFDRERAVPELYRVIAAGGGLALLWNWWDERDPLQAELGELVGYAGHEPYRDDELPGAPWFREVGRTVVEGAEESSAEDLVNHLSTTSAFLTADPAEREAVLRSVRELASSYGERFPFPRLPMCSRSRGWTIADLNGPRRTRQGASGGHGRRSRPRPPVPVGERRHRRVAGRRLGRRRAAR